MSESSDWSDTLLTTPSAKVLYCLLFNASDTFQMLVSSCPDNHYYTCFFEREKKNQAIHSQPPGGHLGAQTPHVVSLYWRVLQDIHLALQQWWGPDSSDPTDDCDFHIFLLRMKEADSIINCKRYCTRKTAVVKICDLNKNVNATLRCSVH